MCVFSSGRDRGARRGSPQDAQRLLTQAIDQRGCCCGPSSRLAGRIHAHLSVFVDLATPAREHAEAALALLDQESESLEAADGDLRGSDVLVRTDRALLASVLMLVFLNEVRTGLSPAAEVLDRALEMEGGHPTWLAGTVPAIWWKGTDQHGRARDRLQSMLDTAAGADEPLQHELMELVELATALGALVERQTSGFD